MKIIFAVACSSAALALWLGRPHVAESLRTVLKNEMAQESTLAAAAASRALVAGLEAAIHGQSKPEAAARAELAAHAGAERVRALANAKTDPR